MSTTAAIEVSPFPGLRPFKEEEEYLFFGRESQVDTMVDKLGKAHFLAVVGPSGSGKSSLVNSGLRPALRAGFMATAGTAWRMVQFRPEDRPLRSMAKALATKADLFPHFDAGSLSLEKIIETNLRMSKRGLVEIYQQARLPEHVNLLVVVDQFEELFRYRRLSLSQGEDGHSVAEDARAFVNLLLEVEKETDYPIYIVLTMRSDFLGDCAQFSGLPEAINEGQYLVPRMTRDERRAAIAGPVAVGGAEITPVLLTRLVNDVGDNPDQLSILQHALNRTWAHWKHEGGSRGPLDLPHYQAIGTMAQALDQHAEKAYAELATERQRQICERLFKTLTDRGTDVRGVRRPTKLGTLCALAEASAEEVVAVIDVFRQPSRSFLMPPAGQTLEADTVIDISHESLMRVWERLKTWVEEEAQSSQMYDRLAEAAVLYEKEEAGLWRDPELQLALAWREENRPTKAWAELYHPGYEAALGFLAESEALRAKEIREKEAQQRRELEQAQALAAAQARANRRLRWFLAFAAVAVVIAFLLWGKAQRASTIAADEKVKADSSALVAQQQRDTAKAEKVRADASAAQAERERQKAERERQRAELESKRAEVAKLEAQSNAAEAQNRRQEADSLRKLAEDKQAEIQAALEQVQMAQDETQRQRKRTLGLALASTSRRQQENQNEEVGALLAHQSFVFDTTSGGQYLNEVYDALRQSLNALGADSTTTDEVDAPPADPRVDWVRAVAYSPDPDGRWIASAGNDGKVRVWDARTDSAFVVGRHAPVDGVQGAVRSLAFSPGGTTLASAGDDNSLRLWRLDNIPKTGASKARQEPPTMALPGRAKAVAFSPDGAYLAVASGNALKIREVVGGSTHDLLLPQPDLRVQAVAFSPDSTTLAAGTDKGQLLVWTDWRKAGSAPTARSAHEGGVNAVAFSPDSRLVATGGADKLVRVWQPDALDGKPLEVLLGHRGPVNAVAFSPDGTMLAAGSADRTVRLWETGKFQTGPIILEGHTGWVQSLAFSPDSQWLVSGSADRTVRRWNVKAERLARAICAAVPDSLGPAEWLNFVGPDIPYSEYQSCTTEGN